MKVRVIVNKQGGTSTGDEQEAERIRAAFAALGVEADVRPTEPDDIVEAFADAVLAPEPDAIVAGGGDGTLSWAGGQSAGTARPFRILPLGTLNPFARAAGIPAALDEAAAVIAAGRTRAVD